MEAIEAARTKLKTCWEEHERSYQNEIRRLEEAENAVQDRLEKLNSKKKEMAGVNGNVDVSDDELVEINAGGKVIIARRATLTQIKGTRLEAIFSGRWDNRLQRDHNGRIFLDVNPTCFQAIIDYLNEMAISPPDHPPEPPSVDSECEEVLTGMLDLFGIYDDVAMCQSKIISSRRDWMVIRNWLKAEGAGEGMKLLYRASSDGLYRESGGCSWKSFTQKCGHVRPTIIIIKDSNGNNVLGGFVNCSWSVNHADKAFIFALSGSDVGKPVKFNLKPGRQACHMHYDEGPGFGEFFSNGRSTDLVINIDKMHYSSEIGSCYESPDDTSWGFAKTSGRISEVEVYQILPTPKSSAEDLCAISKKATKTSEFTSKINEAITTTWQTIYDAEADLIHLEKTIANEETFISSFASGDNKDTVLLSVSGTGMTTKRSTLRICDNSVLSRQFDDEVWTKRTNISHKSISEWTYEDVISWMKGIDDISEDITKNFEENTVTGNQLLALGKDGLQDLGVTQKGLLYFLLREIKKLEEMDECPVTFIEHSPYCFGKIVDFLRLKAAFKKGLISFDPARPIVREAEKGRFEKVVNYFFPGESSQFILN